MARPLKNINKIDFEKLCGMQCTKEEICSWLSVSDKTLENWCKRTYKDENGSPMGFSDVFREKRGRGKVSLRRTQFQLAEKSPAMAIWLGKQYLGQREPQEETQASEDAADDGFIEALRNEAGNVWEK